MCYIYIFYARWFNYELFVVVFVWFVHFFFLQLSYLYFINIKAAGGCPASLRPGRWLDLYSGTGSVGIEALSRGCSEVP